MEKQHSETIRSVTRYEVDGHLFLTPGSAQDFLEGRVAEYVRNLLVKHDLPMSKAVKITEDILNNRGHLAHILDF